MRIPTVHLNGTSGDDLQRAYDELSATLAVAETEIARTYPNGRDYYPQGPEAIGQAMREHEARVTRLRDLKAEIDAIQIGIATQNDQRARSRR